MLCELQEYNKREGRWETIRTFEYPIDASSAVDFLREHSAMFLGRFRIIQILAEVGQ
jgi:hypothetical protein